MRDWGWLWSRGGLQCRRDRHLKFVDQIARTDGRLNRRRRLLLQFDRLRFSDCRLGGTRQFGLTSEGLIFRQDRNVIRRTQTRRIIALEFPQELVFEIEGRLLPLSRRCRLGGRPRLETDDAGEFGERIIIRKEPVVSACAIRQLFSAITQSTRKRYS